MAITSDDKSSGDKEWTPEDEIHLFMALENLKPVGINKHFYMALIVERLSTSLKREVSSTEIWSRLKGMYNLSALDALEPLPFPNDEKVFSLPEPEYVLIKREPEEIKVKVEPKVEPVTPKTTISKQTSKQQQSAHTHHAKEERADKKSIKHDAKESEPKRAPKRTRGSTNSLDTNSPASTPPPILQKRRRI